MEREDRAEEHIGLRFVQPIGALPGRRESISPRLTLGVPPPVYTRVHILAEQDGERIPEVCFVFFQQAAIGHPARLPHARVVVSRSLLKRKQKKCQHGR
jgi:hypothetical protein